jgi:endonuclease/exonuclease/phosphatase family metal-dependent hydrolase
MMNPQAHLIRGLLGCRTLRELRRSRFFASTRAEIESLLAAPQTVRHASAAPRLHAFVRVVQWNIEKGRNFAAVLSCLQDDPVLRWADLVLLNEADYGMIRSGNRHVARDLAEALQMHLVFGPSYLELTKGSGDEANLEGDNRESLQGNAVLSRHPVLEARVVPLPVCFEPYDFAEKRFGRRNCVWARVLVHGRPFWVGSTHLEVRTTPGCRARQMERLLAHLPGCAEESYLLGGDLNSNGFPRGTRWRAVLSAGRLIACSPAQVLEEWLHPDRGCEPLFGVARRAGFDWKGFSAAVDTASAPLSGLEEAQFLPAWLVEKLRKRLLRYGEHVCLRLDWLLGRNIRALEAGEIRDRLTGIASVSPGSVRTARLGTRRASDHSPVFADFRAGSDVPPSTI